DILLDDIRTTDDLPERGRTEQRPEPVWGFADSHAHPASHLAFGQNLLHGEPFGPMAEKLGSCESKHGKLGTGGPGTEVKSIFMSLVEPPYDRETGEPGKPVVGHRPGGYPIFDGWPRYTTRAHQQMHLEWIRRAWQGGLRVMVALAVNNE